MKVRYAPGKVVVRRMRPVEVAAFERRAGVERGLVEFEARRTVDDWAVAPRTGRSGERLRCGL